MKFEAFDQIVAAYSLEKPSNEFLIDYFEGTITDWNDSENENEYHSGFVYAFSKEIRENLINRIPLENRIAYIRGLVNKYPKYLNKKKILDKAKMESEKSMNFNLVGYEKNYYRYLKDAFKIWNRVKQIIKEQCEFYNIKNVENGPCIGTEELKGGTTVLTTLSSTNDGIGSGEAGGDRVETFAEKHLFFLKGKGRSHQPYMSSVEYERLIEYTNYLFEKSALPRNIIPIKSAQIRASEIRYAFCLMTCDRYPDKNYPKFVFMFLDKVFPRLKSKGKENYKDTANYKKFKSPPQYWASLMER